MPLSSSAADIYGAIISARENGQAVALTTVIRVSGSVPRHAGSKMLVWPDGQISGTVGGGEMEARVIKDAQNALADGQSRLVSYTLSDVTAGDPGVCGGTVEVFVEPLLGASTLLVIGCGHVGKALAELGQWLGYRVLVSDDRAEFCNTTNIPGMSGYVICSPAEIGQRVAINQHTYVVAVTRGLPIDVDLIPALLATAAPYVGLIGSRRRWTLTRKALLDRGISADQLARLHAPVGLELQAETPHEIALSIMAEITAIRRGGDGQSMRALNRT